MKKHILKYFLFYLLNVVVLNIILYNYLTRNFKTEAKVTGNLVEKLAYYKAHRSDYTLLFIGDSRTYTNIHDPMIDSVLGVRSINLAMWANWFPTQYPFYQDILPEIPENSIVVWSIGHQNFSHTTDFEHLEETYPIGFRNLSTYMNWGFSLRQVSKNLKKYDLNSVLVTQPDWMKFWVRSILDKKLCRIEGKNNLAFNQVNMTEPLFANAYEKLKRSAEANKDILMVRPVTSGDTITSAELYWKHGNYWRVELDSLFFRSKQKEDGLNRSKSTQDHKADERYMANFYAIVELLKPYQKKLKIIINEFEEAPYVYNEGEKEEYERMMASVRDHLKTNGFSIIKVDFTEFTNSDYFDFNHMNSKGTIKYTEKFAKALKQELAL